VYLHEMAVGPQLFSGLIPVPAAVRGAETHDSRKAFSDKALERFWPDVAARTHNARSSLPPWDRAGCPPERGFRAWGADKEEMLCFAG